MTEEFLGTVRNGRPNEKVMITTSSSENERGMNLCKNSFHLLLVRNSDAIASISSHNVKLFGKTVICLNDLKQLQVISGYLKEIKIISFLPIFLNVNMTLSKIRGKDYQNFCEQHLLFQLSPFLNDDGNNNVFSISEDTYQKISCLINNISSILEKQSKKYWSCQARSYFIDIINIIERIHHGYFLDFSEETDISKKNDKNDDFKKIIEYINNHLDEKITLKIICEKFYMNKNKLNTMFKTNFNITFAEYVGSRRFEEACYYLKFTELDGDIIASRLAFSCSQNFCRFFSRYANISPEKYRKNSVEERKKDMMIRNDT